MRVLEPSYPVRYAPAMSSAAAPLMTPEEFLTFEREAEAKHEYHDGIVTAMAGGTGPHAELAMRFGSELCQRIKGGPCRIYSSDMKVWIASLRKYLYPDISGLCGESQFQNETRDVLLNPAFVVEILSRTTEAYDRGRKLSYYMEVPSVQEILLVSQEEWRVDKYTRQADGIWRFEAFAGTDAVLPVLSIDGQIPLRDFYAGVELDPPSPSPARS